MAKQDIIRGILYGIFLIIVFFVVCPSKYSITEEYVFKVDEDTDIRFAILIPKSNAYQIIKDPFLKSEVKYELLDYGDLQVLRSEDIISKTNNRIVFTYQADLKRGKITWNEELKDIYLRPETDIESDNDILIAKATDLVEGTRVSDVYSIYDFVSKYLKWPKGDRYMTSQSALAAFNSKEGVCGEFANLMVALCRAGGIPAKSISGLLVPVGFKKARPWDHQAGSHAWVEFYADGKWHFADPSRGGGSYFDKTKGLYISYGDKENQNRVYDENIEWAKRDGFQICAAMSAPLKFIISSRQYDVTVIPSGTVKRDVQYYMLLFMAVILCIGIETMMKRILRKSLGSC